jgi:hypothetical protein
MATRNLLHKTKLSKFLDFVVEKGANIEKPNGSYQKARFRFPGKPPHIIWEKNTVKEHYVLEDKTINLFWEFHNQTKKGK